MQKFPLFLLPEMLFFVFLAIHLLLFCLVHCFTVNKTLNRFQIDGGGATPAQFQHYIIDQFITWTHHCNQLMSVFTQWTTCATNKFFTFLEFCLFVFIFKFYINIYNYFWTAYWNIQAFWVSNIRYMWKWCKIVCLIIFLDSAPFWEIITVQKSYLVTTSYIFYFYLSSTKVSSIIFIEFSSILTPIVAWILVTCVRNRCVWLVYWKNFVLNERTNPPKLKLTNSFKIIKQKPETKRN